MYSTRAELVEAVASFLADGLNRGERCWYIGSGDEMDAVRSALQKADIDVAGSTARRALQLMSGDGAYVIHGSFDPEATLHIFNDAIEQAYTDGFAGFRAAAEMSWALACDDGGNQLIVYEALLRSLFGSCKAIGLCLYDRTRMPLAVIDGALATHPIVGVQGRYGTNPFYDSNRHHMVPADGAEVRKKLSQLVPVGRARVEGRSPRS